MSTKSQAYIPQAAVWFIRLAVNPTLSRNLQHDPVTFAAWYAAVSSVIHWPDPVIRIQEIERAKRLPLDRMLKLLSQVNYAISGRTNAEHARLSDQSATDDAIVAKLSPFWERPDPIPLPMRFSSLWRMFLIGAAMVDKIESVDTATRESWEQRLLFMRNLTPGDFATVKRQCLVLDTTLTPEGWLEQLELECEIKNAAPGTNLGHAGERG
jgi:hypothetical protein